MLFRTGGIHPLCNASRGEGGNHDLLHYCLIDIDGYTTHHYERGRGVSETKNLALCTHE